MNPKVVAIITAAIETVGFVYWIAEVFAGHALRGLLGFDAILIIEHTVQAYLLTHRVRFVEIVLFSQFETFVVWGAGLAIGQALNNLAVAPLYWMFGLTIEHTVTDNVLRGQKLLAKVFDFENLPASAIEAAGGYLSVVALPVSLVTAVIVWFVPNTLEHAMLDARALRPVGAP